MSENKTLGKEENGLKGSRLWGILLFVILLLVDMLTKFFADAYFSAEGAVDRVEIIPGHIALCQYYNTGVAFSGMDDAAPWVKILMIVGTALLMALFAVAYFKIDKRRTVLRVALVLIVAGGVGNLIDRIYYRVWDPEAMYGVRDMVDINIWFFSAVCNFADFWITGGAVVLIVAMLFFDKDAFFPVGEKYKALAREAEEERKAKDKEKRKASKALRDKYIREAEERRAAEARKKDGQNNG